MKFKINKVIFFTSFFALTCTLSFGYSRDYPNTFTLNPTNLAENKRLIESGNVILNKAKINLLVEADKMVENGNLYSVVFKKLAPEGGTLNDFYSLSKYWWPNPETVNGLPYINIDGKVNPENDSIPDMDMFQNLRNDAFILGLAYFYSGDERYANHLQQLIWYFFLNNNTKMNPNIEFSQVIRGKPNSGGATISFIGLIDIIESIQLIEKSNAWTNRDNTLMKKWINSFADWMLNSEKGKKDGASNNNIGTYYLVQVVTYKLFVGERNVARRLLVKRAPQLINEQINSEGEMLLELKRVMAWDYIKFNFVAFNKLIELGRKFNLNYFDFEGSSKGSINKAYDWLKSIARNERVWNYGNQKVDTIQARIVLQRSDDVSELIGDSIYSQPYLIELVKKHK